MGQAAGLGRRIVYGTAAFFTADLITGMAAFSVIALGSLWVFCLGFLEISAEYEARGLAFATGYQLFLAWIGVFVAIPLLVLVVYLAIRAFALPRSLYRFPLTHPSLGRIRRHRPA